MLTQYQQTTQLLLKDPKMERFNLSDLTSYINTARGQIAGEAECIRANGTLAVLANVQYYPFTQITFPGAPGGIAGALNVRMINFYVAGGQKSLVAREWEWFNQFVMANPVPVPAPPRVWAQYGQGVAGSIFINLPDYPYTLQLDTVCYPSPLAINTDPEAIPYLWTDAVPYFAAYMALLTEQDQDNAQKMFQLYRTFVDRARRAATPSVLPGQYESGPDPMMQNRLGVQAKGA